MTRERRLELLKLSADPRAPLAVRFSAALMVFVDQAAPRPPARPELAGAPEYFPPGKDPRK